MKTYLSVGEVAEVIGMSADYVSRKCNDGAIRAVKLGNTWRIPRDAVDEFMRTESPDPEAVTRARPDLTARQRRAVEQRMAAAGHRTP